MAEVLLTGATGLLGSNVLAALAPAHRVWAMTQRATSAHQESEVRWVLHDLRNPSLPPELPDHMDVVVHLAQAREFRDFPGRALDIFGVNLASTALLLDYAERAGAHQFVLASTGSVYRPGPAAHREEETVDMAQCPSFYVASKMASEALGRAYRHRFSVLILRPFFVYGRGQDPTMLLPRLAGDVRARRPIVIDGEDGMRFNPVHVSDAACAVVTAIARQASGVVNLAGPEVLSLRQAVEELATVIGIPAEVVTRPSLPPVDFVADTTRMSALLGPPRVTLREAAADVAARPSAPP